MDCILDDENGEMDYSFLFLKKIWIFKLYIRFTTT